MEGGKMEVSCSSCNARYNIPDEKVPKKKAVMKCKKCGGKVAIDPQQLQMPAQQAPPAPPAMGAGETDEQASPASPAMGAGGSAQQAAPAPPAMESGGTVKVQGTRFKEYKVMHVVEGGCGTLLLGSSGVPIKKMEILLNEAVAEGWQVVFQVVEAKRYLLFWTREAIIITLGR